MDVEDPWKDLGLCPFVFPGEEKWKSSVIDLRLLFYYKPKDREKAILSV